VRLPEGYERRNGEGGWAVVRSDLPEVPFAGWWTAGTELADAAGRGAVTRAELGGVQVVLRQYRRGGMLRGLLPDRYPSPRRALDELVVLVRLAAAGVPVVRPVAAVARRRGLGYELRLATEWVDGARTLPGFVAAVPEARRESVAGAGRAIRAAFDAGLLHPDLHPDNVLARREADGRVTVVLLDFDRAKLVEGPASERARDAMLVRMARYLEKHAHSLPARASAVDHLRFLRGLGLDRAARRAAVLRLRPKLLAQLRRRGRFGERSPGSGSSDGVSS
jgi:hypothetical protein